MPARNIKQLISWCLFDFANSSYSAVIGAVVFPVYYVTAIVGNDHGQGDLWWGRAIAASMTVVALTSPFMGGIADYSGSRKRLLALYTGATVTAVACLALLDRGMAAQGFVLIVIANVGMEGGLVFYNSYLTDISPPGALGRVSSWGFAVGYAGSILGLLLALPLIRHSLFEAVWLLVAAFFAIFAGPAFLFLPADHRRVGGSLLEDASRGAIYSWRTFGALWRKKGPRRFLVAFLLYQDGVSTVIVFSSIFAATTLGFAAGELVGLYLVVQMTALAGAVLTAPFIDRWGPRRIIVPALLLWSGVAATAAFVSDKGQFWALAGTAGLGLGTVQAASRALFAGFVPAGQEGEYFGVYSLVGKSSAILGPLLFGQISSASGSQRPAILAIAGLFLAGLFFLHLVPEATKEEKSPDKPKVMSAGS